MTHSRSRRIAASALAVGGGLVGVAALGLVAVKAAMFAGVDLPTADARLLDDILPLVPFIAAFAAANLVTAVALFADRAWADRLALSLATIAVSVGLVATTLVVLGHDPFAAGSSLANVADGLAILAAFTTLYALVIAAVSLAGRPDRSWTPAIPLSY
jgi:hypothetical protein